MKDQQWSGLLINLKNTHFNTCFRYLIHVKLHIFL